MHNKHFLSFHGDQISDNGESIVLHKFFAHNTSTVIYMCNVFVNADFQRHKVQLTPITGSHNTVWWYIRVLSTMLDPGAGSLVPDAAQGPYHTSSLKYIFEISQIVVNSGHRCRY